MELLIWWTNQADCEAIGDYLPKALPTYLCDQYRSRRGRAGRGRLWVDKSLDFDPFGVVRIPYPETPLSRLLGEAPRLGQTYAGIVIYKTDAPLLDTMPGIITTLKLVRWHD